MLAWYMLWPCVCMCVSVTSQCSAKMAQWIELIFGIEATLCYKEIRVTLKIRVLPPDFVQNAELRTFCHGDWSRMSALDKSEGRRPWSFCCACRPSAAHSTADGPGCDQG